MTSGYRPDYWDGVRSGENDGEADSGAALSDEQLFNIRYALRCKNILVEAEDVAEIARVVLAASAPVAVSPVAEAPVAPADVDDVTFTMTVADAIRIVGANSTLEEMRRAFAANSSSQALTLHQRITELSAKYGSLRAAARDLETDPGYLSRLAAGEKTDPGDLLLVRMGLRRVVTYERLESTAKPPAQAGTRMTFSGDQIVFMNPNYPKGKA